jgi:predicted protein tyrosine phosphatase
MEDIKTCATEEDAFITLKTIRAQLNAGKRDDKRLSIGECEQRLLTEPISRICPGLFVSGIDAAQDKALLFEHSIEAVLSVNNFESTFDYATGKISHLYLKTQDHSDFPIEKYFEVAHAFVMEAMMNGRNVLVHCAAGMSRSVTIAMYILLRYLYETDRKGVDAYLAENSEHSIFALLYDYFRLKRPVISPELGFQAKLRIQEAKFRTQDAKS